MSSVLDELTKDRAANEARIAAEEATKRKSDTAPKKRPGRPPGQPLQKRLLEAIGAVGVVVSIRNEADGQAILEGAERLATALDKLAKQNPAVKRALEAALTTGVYGELFFAVGAIFVPIALNHGALPASIIGPTALLFSTAAQNGSGSPTEPDAEPTDVGRDSPPSVGGLRP